MALLGPSNCTDHIWEWTGMSSVKCLSCKAVEKSGHAQNPGSKMCLECKEIHF